MLASHTIGSVQDRIARDLVYGVAIVGVVINWDSSAGVVTETGGNVGQVEPGTEQMLILHGSL